MNKTKDVKVEEHRKIAVKTEELQGLLSCGRSTAVKIGEDAKAKIQYGKIVLWNVEKIRKYLYEYAS